MIKHFTEASAPVKCNGNALVDVGAEAPRPRLSPVEMRMLTPAGGLLHAGSASATLESIFPSQPLAWSFGEHTENMTTHRKKLNQLAPSCRYE